VYDKINYKNNFLEINRNQKKSHLVVMKNLNSEIIPLSTLASGSDSKIRSAQQGHYPKQFQNLNNCIKLMG
jgi:hypothetical protein